MLGMGIRAPALASALALAGCYQSYPFTMGVDGGDDASVDAWDVDVDPDLDADVDPWEVDPDIPSDAGETCIPPVDYIITVSFFLDDYGHDEEVNIKLVCAPPVITGSSEVADFHLDCEDGPHVFTLDVRPGISSAVADIPTGVVLEYISRDLGEGWSFKWFTLRGEDGDLIMAGVQSNDLAPPDRVPEEWYAPVWVGSVGGLCPIENPGCYTVEREALDVICGGFRERFFEDSRGRMGTTGECYVQVGEAFRTVRISCAGLEMPSQYYAAIIVR